MSAFVVDKRHIDLIVHAVIHGTEDGEHVWWSDSLLRQEIAFCLPNERDFGDELGQLLLDENVRSVRYRYDDDENMIPYYARQPYCFEPLPFRPTVVELLKALNCYIYESCEHPDWEDSMAYKIVMLIRNHAIYMLPGYEEAPWEWTEDEVQKRIQARVTGTNTASETR